jgi:HK97 family phage major capsid protein
VKNFKDAREAFRFGRFIAAASGHRKSADWCESNGLSLKAHSEGVNSAGGFLVPDEFEASLINLREQFGVFRANAKVYPMSRDTLLIPRRVGTLTSYWVGETKAASEEVVRAYHGFYRVGGRRLREHRRPSGRRNRLRIRVARGSSRIQRRRN